MKNKIIICAVIGLMMCLASGAVATTIATFADPSNDPCEPLFTVDMTTNKLLTGGWGDDKTGLTLEVVYSGNYFTDAFFTMTNVIITDEVSWMGYKTEAGTIEFFADEVAEPLVRIDFDSAWVSFFGVGAADYFLSNDNVVISGSEIDTPLMDEEFAFGFANHRSLDGGWSDGYTATAALTSSGISIPEPATVLLLGVSSCFVLPRRKRGN